jgi:hypothetical protein
MISQAKHLASTLCIALVVGVLPAALRVLAQPQQTVQARTVKPAAVSGDLVDMQNAIDGRMNTRATSGKADYVGMSVTMDAGGLQNIIGVRQEFGPWATHYPGAIKLDVAESLSGPWMTAFEGPGQRGVIRTEFPAIRARYVRITATARNTLYREDWSIAELMLGVDPGQTARRIATRPDRPDRPPVTTLPAPAPRTLRDPALATDRKLETRASSGTPDYRDMSITVDLRGEYELSHVVQLHGRWAEDYPAEYKIETSRQTNESRFREVWRGEGTTGRSVARFEPVTTRYIRITALRTRRGDYGWSIAEVRTNRDPGVVEDDEDDPRLDRQIRSVRSSGFVNDSYVADESNATRATTNNANYAGSWLQADLGGSYTISKVVQVHDPSNEDYPRRYRIEVSQDGRRWETVFEGRGEEGRSRATFNPVRARFVRITAINPRETQRWWSISRLRIAG